MSKSTHIDKPAEELSELLSSFEACITYVPLRTEVPFEEATAVPASLIRYEIAPRASLNPQSEALRAIEVCNGKRTVILLPGRMFDIHGTRHGQGGGWYDRFLSYVPPTWLRIGFCFTDQLSTTLLMRHPWDEPMDVVCVCERNTNRLVALYKNDRVSVA